MSRLAEATQALQLKKEEQAAIETELLALAERRASGEAGRLQLTVTSVHAVERDAPVLEDIQVMYAVGEAGDVHEGECSLLETVSIGVLSKDTIIRFSGSYCTAAVDSPSKRTAFTAQFDCKEAPDDTCLTCDLETTCSTLIFRIQAGFDSIEGSIESKKVELAQASEECKKLTQAVRDVATTRNQESSAGSSPASKKKSPKKAKASDAAAAGAAATPADPASLSARVARITKNVTANLGVATEFLTHSRAYWLFAAASAAIYFYGDYASI